MRGNNNMTTETKETKKQYKPNQALPRKYFGQKETPVPIPYLLKIPKDSYGRFLQAHINPKKRKQVGLENLFRVTFPLKDANNRIELRYLGYEIGDWECPICGYKPGETELGGPEEYCPHCLKKEGKKIPLVWKKPYTPSDCKEKGLTYSAPLRVLLQVATRIEEDRAQELGLPIVEEGKTKLEKIAGKGVVVKKENGELWWYRPPKKVYFGEVPLMTEEATFITNGTERIIVNQLIRSPGLFYEIKEDRAKEGPIARKIYKGSVVSDKGVRVEFELTSTSDEFYARLNKKKIGGSTVFRAWGLETAYDILKQFYPGTKKLIFQDGAFIDTETGEELTLEDLEGYNLFALLRYKAFVQDTQTEEEFIEERYIDNIGKLKRLLSDDRYNIVFLTAVSNQEATKSPWGKIPLETLIKETHVKAPENASPVRVPARFSFADYAKIEIYKKLRPLEPITLTFENLAERARNYYRAYFQDLHRYDLSHVGRVKLNARAHKLPKEIRPEDIELLDKIPPLALAEDIEINGKKYEAGTRLTKELAQELFEAGIKVIPVKDYTEEEARFLQWYDLVAIVKKLIDLRFERDKADSVAHLGNRRVRPVGELLEAQARMGVARMERVFRDKSTIVNPENPELKPQDLINPRHITTAIMDFLKTGQLSQYLDHTNPLTGLTHKRRMSALGPGGLTRESAKFEIRDVHPSHYGRICPIETPEGQNIGLVTSPTVFAQLNEYGFLITPYRKVEDGKVTDKVEWLAAYEEEDKFIAQYSPTDKEGNIVSDRILVRWKSDIHLVTNPKQIDYMDLSPKQVISPSSSLIPFLEHDDANRALMGSNMQRQAVPLIKTSSPLIGTGMEKVIARDSHAVVVAKRGGVVEEATSDRIIIRVNRDEINFNDPNDLGIDIYELKKFNRTNQDTCLNQKPLVRPGQKVEKGEVIADGYSTEKGELALGKDVLVAFMPWRGYNFEDAIVISERLVKEDVFTSIHIEELEAEARETKQGEEIITRNIPGVPEKMLANLDEHGIVRIGTYVKPGDILVGKVRPKEESQTTPEEKLLQAVFGEKTRDVEDASLRCPPGLEGTVIDVKVFVRKDKNRKDPLAEEVIREEEEKLQKEYEEKKKLLLEGRNIVLKELLIGHTLDEDVKVLNQTILPKGEKITEENIEKILSVVSLNPSKFIKDKELLKKVEEITNRFKLQLKILERIYEEKKKQLQKGGLKPGVNTLVKIYIAQKRKIKVGDKMAGRHGNKGVISVVLPVEDMPFLEDGTPVDIVLNPLGVPSRMNIGQILETHLGFAAKKLGEKLGQMLQQGLNREEITKQIVDIFAVGDKDGKFQKEIKEWLDSLDEDSFKQVVKEYAKKGIPIATPVFEGAKEAEIKTLLKMAGLPESGKITLYDGRTGEPFDMEVTVGYMHMLKLIHMVDDKIHARATGPYSLVTQQPLGGKAQFGGQRLGEMEVWALEAHGAAYTLQEMLTVKSDDIEGRTKVYEAIVNGKYVYTPGLPESFKVLVRELKGLALDVRCINYDEAKSVGCDQVKVREDENDNKKKPI
jgi:DNA-directed RNA polymerase subunit beta